MLKDVEPIGARRNIGFTLPYYFAYYYRYAESRRIRKDLLVLAALLTFKRSYNRALP